MAQWSGKWALVTGASAGIGEALAEQLATGGANLVLTARRGDRLTELATRLSAQHKIQTEVFLADLAQPQAPEAIFHFTQQKQLPIDILINNAGFGAYGRFDTVEPQRLLDMLQVNVTAVLHLTRLYLPAMVERHTGYVMIVSSTGAFQAVPYISTYVATKAFELHFAQGIAEELRREGVHVCALCPGSTVSEFHEVARHPPHSRGRMETSEKVARVGLEALAAGKPWVMSGLRNRILMEVQRLLPRNLVVRVTGKMFDPHT